MWDPFQMAVSENGLINGGFLDPNCPYHAMGSHPPGVSSRIPALLPDIFNSAFGVSGGSTTLSWWNPPRTRRRFETLNKNAIQIDNATKTKEYVCWQKCSISTMFDLLAKKNNRKKDLAIEEELLEAA